MMRNSTCPFCHLTVPPSQLDRHANSHFDDDDDDDDDDEQERLARHWQLAQQISLVVSNNNETSAVSSALAGDMDQKISSLVGLQMRSSCHHVKDGLMTLLYNCLELELQQPHNSATTSTTLLSGFVDHFQSIIFEDAGWGCGWRNIQMLASHLLFQRQDARDVLFGASGFVPDIPSLQRWLEIAWERGFDAPGSHHFNHKIYGSKNWIGTTECAALLRSFGLRARVVDFGPKELQPLFLSVPGSSTGHTQLMSSNARGYGRAAQFYGPMDKFLFRWKSWNPEVPQPQAGSIRQEKPKYSSDPYNDTSGHEISRNMENNQSRKSEGNQALIDWVWDYFSDKSLTTSGRCHVVVTCKAPLYFQHDGHSRTIVGIQVKHQMNGMPQCNLLILDPAHRTTALEKSLTENVGWQKLIKRGVHTLKKPQYQLCYIDPGIASGEEMEQLKTINSVFVEIS